jgi:hypothetical protein
MVKLPDPPRVSRLRAVGAEVTTIPQGTPVSRIHFQAGPYPTTWGALRWIGPSGARFDHHRLPRGKQKRGILYAALEGVTCLAEVFQNKRIIDVHLGEPWFVTFELARDVVVLDLTGDWPTRAGASVLINAGNRARARAWSAAIYEAFPQVEGLLYCSSMAANRRALALYERAQSAIPAAPVTHRSLADSSMRSLIREAADKFGYFMT